MTTMRYGLGYNKDGVLGVAGLLGGSGASAAKLGILLQYLGNYSDGSGTSTAKFLADGTSQLSDLAQTPNHYSIRYASGGGRIALWISSQVGYAPIGQSPLWITDDGATWKHDITTIAGRSIVFTGSYSNMVSISNIQYENGKFYVFYSVYDSMGMSATGYYTTTQDFVTFTNEIAMPIAGNSYSLQTEYFYLGQKNYYSRLFVNSVTGEHIISNYMEQDFYSADGVTWTAVGLPSRIVDIATSSLGTIFVNTSGAWIVTLGTSTWLSAIQGYASLNYYNILPYTDRDGTGMPYGTYIVSAEVYGDYILALNDSGGMGYPTTLNLYRIQDVFNNAGTSATLLDIDRTQSLGSPGSLVGVQNVGGTLYYATSKAVGNDAEITLNTVDVSGGSIAVTNLLPTFVTTGWYGSQIVVPV